MNTSTPQPTARHLAAAEEINNHQGCRIRQVHCALCRHVAAIIAKHEQGANEQTLRRAWELGFALAVSYGDNYIHCDGEQKERQWKTARAALAQLDARRLDEH